MVNLTYLMLPKNTPFDFSGMTQLNELDGIWSDQWTGLGSCVSLSKFSVMSMAVENMESIPNLECLHEISLISTDIVSLQGIASAKKLRHLSIFHAEKLVDISAVVALAPSLERLELSFCMAVVDFGCVRELQGLRELVINHAGVVSRLTPVPSERLQPRSTKPRGSMVRG